MIYLDNAATTKPKQEVIKTIISYLSDKWCNPSSLYGEAVEVKNDIKIAREIIANFINAKSNEIYFTSSGSEGNCWAIQGFVNYWTSKNIETTIITTTIEHKSIMSCVENLHNVELFYIDVDKNGFIDLQQLERILRWNRVYNHNDMTLISIQMSNNEIGTIQRIKEIAELAHKYHAVFHTDATQTLGHILIDVKKLDIDMMTASGHKIGAPKGVAFLYKKDGIEINPLIYGSQMDSMRGGTENVAYIMGMAKAVELCKDNVDITNIRNYMIDKLKENFNCKINGSLDYRLPNNINATFSNNITGEALLYTLDLSDIKVSTGSACNSHSIEPSYVLKAIGLSDEEAMRTIRFSLPDDITYDDVDYVIKEINKAIKIIEV